METERKALYRLLRMHSLQDPSVVVQPWQVEDYRKKSLEQLFDGLKKLGMPLNRERFLAYAEEAYSPEELAACLADEDGSVDREDQAYLLLFELWRRLLPEKPSISIFCDELDEEISLHDQGEVQDGEKLQDLLANLQKVLEENADQSDDDPMVVFESLSTYCANDVESFLYDFIAEQIDEENYSYASELLEGFLPFVSDKKWFELLKVCLISSINPQKAAFLIQELVEVDATDLEFLLEVLQFLAHWGSYSLFQKTAKIALTLIAKEDEFQDFLDLCADYYQSIDADTSSVRIRDLIKKSIKRATEAPFLQSDPRKKELLVLLNSESPL